MKKRFCDICEGEIQGGLTLIPLNEVETLAIHQISVITPETVTVDWCMCSTCIIKAVGKIYVEQYMEHDVFLNESYIDMARNG